jgi:hypothetical protein
MTTIQKLFNLNPSDNTINNLNTGLMLLSLLVAMAFPFELFLFSFIVLGPLHYLTEVSWLQKRGFFMRNQWEAFFLIGLCIIMVLLIVFPVGKSSDLITSLICLGFIFAFIVILVESLFIKIALMLVITASIFFFGLYKAGWFAVIFGIFMTSIIHTTIFTGIFIMSGITKNRTVSGVVSLVVFIVCSAFFFIVPLNIDFYQVSPYAKEAFGFFVIVNKTISDFFHFGHFTKLDDVFYSKEGLAIIRFVAFAYTYHYLNWFTKTSIIKWHEVTNQRLITIGLIWICLVGLYLYDLKIGLIAAYVFAMMHTLLEFPLNHRAFLSIFNKPIGK